MNPTQADLDEFGDFVREVHKFHGKLAAEVRKQDTSLEGQGKFLLDKFGKLIKKLEKP